MSAYMCTDEHFKQLAAWLCNDDRSSLDWLARMTDYPNAGYMGAEDLATHLANILKRENARSLAARYPHDHEDMHDEKPLTVTLGEVTRMASVDLSRIHSATRCLEYQSCETQDWPQSKACWICQQIYKEIGARLPGEGPWGQPVEFAEPAPKVVSLMSLVR